MKSNEQRGGLADKFEGFGAMPSDTLWGNIAEELDQKKSRKVFFWWWLFGGMAASIIGLGIYSSLENDAAIDKLVKNSTTSDVINRPFVKVDKSVNSIDENSLKESNFVEKIEDEHSLGVKESKKPEVGVNNIINQKDELKLIVENKSVIHQEQSIEVDKYEQAEIHKINQLNSPLIKKLKTNLNNTNHIRCAQQKKRFWRFWEVGFRIGYYRSSELHSNEVASEQSSSSSVFTGSDSYISGSESLYSQNVSFSPTYQNQGSVKRNVNLDFTAGKYLTKRWMLNTGLNFSRAAYNTNYQASNGLIVDTKITTLAVPLGVSFDLLKRKKFKFRVVGAVNNEFAISECVLMPNNSYQKKSKSLISGYSGAIDFSVSTLFRVGPRWQLSVSPSYRRYFTQNIRSSNLLLRKDHWFGGTIGLVLTL